jgi:type II secretory ATPase GspE/PulE/Tfp pilus assembly ATPase PilB-like protein
VLGFHGEALERVHEAMRRKGGLILVAGPAGSGKTTTLYTMLDILNQPDLNLATIEDPVEYQMKRVSQTQADAASGFTMAAGLRAVLRQDPDIVMVGEIRDAETATLAVNAALTGRLVLAAIPADSAAHAIARLSGMGIDPFLLVSTLRLAIGQRLVRRLSDGKEQYALGKDARDAVAQDTAFSAALGALSEEKLVKAGTKVENLPFYRPVQTAASDGYAGSVGLFEVLPVSESIRELILHEAAPDRILERARKEGMLTLQEDGIYKAARGITSLEEVQRVLGS